MFRAVDVNESAAPAEPSRPYRYPAEPGMVEQSMTSLLKSTRITERVRTEFRVEAFNAPNQVTFTNPAADRTAPANFGKIRGTSVEARAIQLGLKNLF